ncbi:MAG: tetratricopeptide repeat protein [Rhodospirillales bacterium]|nr:tetratricopeptide repeat protein [Rhodospirillales bacterium]
MAGDTGSKIMPKLDDHGKYGSGIGRSIAVLMVIIVSLLAVPRMAAAGPLEGGAAAKKRGDYRAAIKQYRKAVKRGDVKAKFALGKLYLDGRGVKKDAGEALKWFRGSAQGGNVEAQRMMAIIYDGSHSVKRDRVRAFKWYSIAARRGDQEARILLTRLKRRMNHSQLKRGQKLLEREGWTASGKKGPRKRRARRAR